MMLLLALFACPSPSNTDTGEVVPPLSCVGDDDSDALLTIQPYVQLVTPTSAWILWETDEGEGSRVDFGATDAVEQGACGAVVPVLEGAETTDGQTFVHEVQLTELQPGTIVNYRVRTGDTVSEVFRFRTPELPAAEASLRLVAMSDAQIDVQHSDKFREIVEEGILPFTEASFGGAPHEVLSMVLMPGDLVDNGWIAPSWAGQFFKPAHKLLAEVPLYPAVGNHEGQSPHYFRYFHLPSDPVLGEHAYAVRQSNLLVLTLDSNNVLEVEQTAWLDAQLDAACTDPEIDFVFAQLHHPWLSELWTPGESTFTASVVTQLESFTASCEKPSVHFFGHTHGYSRGQLRDHPHLMINVASAGGAIDRWGAHPQEDYAEFSVSYDTWGFVVLEVTAGDAPSFRFQRVSRGNADNPVDNVVTDGLTLWRFNDAPDTPVVSSDVARCVDPVLQASAFADPEAHAHQGTQWQVAPTCAGLAAPLVDRWRQRQNHFGGVDLQAGDDLTDEAFPELTSGQSACARVRYRDEGLVWSEWSDAVELTVPSCAR